MRNCGSCCRSSRLVLERLSSCMENLMGSEELFCSCGCASSAAAPRARGCGWGWRSLLPPSGPCTRPERPCLKVGSSRWPPSRQLLPSRPPLSPESSPISKHSPESAFGALPPDLTSAGPAGRRPAGDLTPKAPGSWDAGGQRELAWVPADDPAPCRAVAAPSSPRPRGAAQRRPGGQGGRGGTEGSREPAGEGQAVQVAAAGGGVSLAPALALPEAARPPGWSRGPHPRPGKTPGPAARFTWKVEEADSLAIT